jgi:hypothetical protein
MWASTRSGRANSLYEFPKIETKNGRPIFSLLVIGTSGAGKTVLIAAVGEQLSVLKESAFALTSSTTLQADYLKGYYASIRRDTDDWPPSTAGSTEFEFVASCPDTRMRGEKTIFTVRYKDYPGGYVEKPRAEDDLSIRESMKSAHILVFLIDGSKLLYRKARKSKDGLPSLGDELNISAPYAQECLTLTRPVQFIITKWDVVKTVMSLEEARGYLMENQNFCAIVSQFRKRQLPVHIIPISVVGDGFAVWSADTNKMKKCPGATAQPYNLEVSMALAISDAVLQRSLAAASKADMLKRHVFKALATGGPVVKWLAGATIFIFDDSWIIRAASLIDKVAARVAVSSEKALRDIEARIQNAKDLNSAIEAVVEKQQFIAVKFLDANRAASI